MTKDQIYRLLLLVGTFMALIGAGAVLSDTPADELKVIIGIVIGSNAVIFCQSLAYLVVNLGADEK